MRRKLWTVLALAALLGCGAALADSEYSFSTQPTNVFRGSDNCFVISWETSFTPVKIEIRKWHDGSSETLATVTAASQLRAAMSYPLPDHDDYSSDYYRVLAFYGSGTTDYEWSNSFTLDWDGVDFTSTPTSDFMPSYSDFRVSIPCSFTPVKAEIRQNYALVWSGTPSGSYFFVPLSAVYEGSCDLRVYYGDGPYDYVTLYSYRLSWDDVKFVKDAAVGVSPDGTCFRLSWETSFYPTRIKIWKNSDSGAEILEDRTENLNFGGYYDLPFTYDDSDVKYYVAAYYNDGHCKYSQYAAKDMSLLKFTAQPKNGVVSVGNGYYHVSWETSFTPARIEIGPRISGDVFPLVTLTEGLSRKMGYDLSSDFQNSEGLFIKAYFPGAEYLSRTSQAFTVSPVLGCHFTSYPQAGSVYHASYLPLRWTTDFMPIYVNVMTYNENGSYCQMHTLDAGRRL